LIISLIIKETSELLKRKTKTEHNYVYQHTFIFVIGFVIGFTCP